MEENTNDKYQAGKLNFYQEKHRPQFHFSPEEKWMNDPNGMVYYDGEYHLFFQYHPESTIWGPMHWGHAVSRDLVYWEQLPIALYPDKLGHIFSGSAVIDKNNTAGFGKNAMIAIYTYHNMEEEKSGKSIRYQSQAIAYSTDRGRTFTKYEGNPVIPNPGIKDFRDPKVYWDEERSCWLMVLATYYNSLFYSSPDLKNWTYLSEWGKAYGEHGGVWECPDIFPLEVEGAGETKWVLLQSLNPGGPCGGSGTQYFIGDFDGKNFVLDSAFEEFVKDGKAIWLDYGADNYAGVTWSNHPQVDGRKYFIGWMSNWQYAQTVPTASWRSAMTLPRSIGLYRQGKNYRLRCLPIENLKKIEKQRKALTAGVYDTGTYLLSTDIDKMKLHLFFGEVKAEKVLLRFSNVRGEALMIAYDTFTCSFYIDRREAGPNDFEENFSAIHTAPKINEQSSIEFLIYLDVASIELFADHGSICMTEIIFPSKPFDSVELIVDGGTADLSEGSVTSLNSIWRK